MAPVLDLDSFLAAFAARDVQRWLAHYAPDAEWWEYRHADPPSRPHVMRGRDAIARHIEMVAAADLELRIESPVLDDRRAAFTVWIDRPGGLIVENVIVEHRNGLVVRQTDVEAWD
jgi:hypothetical protein